MMLLATLACGSGQIVDDTDTHYSCDMTHSYGQIQIYRCTYTCDSGEVYPDTFYDFNKPEQTKIDEFCNPVAAASVAEAQIATEPPTEAAAEAPTEASYRGTYRSTD